MKTVFDDSTLGSTAGISWGTGVLVVSLGDVSTLGARGTVEDAGGGSVVLETDSMEVGLVDGTAAERCKSLAISSIACCVEASTCKISLFLRKDLLWRIAVILSRACSK